MGKRPNSRTFRLWERAGITWAFQIRVYRGVGFWEVQYQCPGRGLYIGKQGATLREAIKRTRLAVRLKTDPKFKDVHDRINGGGIQIFLDELNSIDAEELKELAAKYTPQNGEIK